MENEIICYCSQVNNQEIIQSIKDGAKTLPLDEKPKYLAKMYWQKRAFIV